MASARLAFVDNLRILLITLVVAVHTGITYAVYVIHAPVVILLTLALRGVRLYPLLKFALALLVIVPACFALANVIRKLPGAGRIL
jgi:peptidoglycan/LPS O-acetylase OafA/YrhL